MAAIVLIAIVTLLPGEPTVSTPSHCLICGDRGLADAILNLTLFLPLGAALALARVRPTQIVAVGLGLSMMVELMQWLIPGRDPSAGDLLFNTAGAGIGSTVPFVILWWRTVPPARARVWAAACAAIASLMVIVAGVLLRPSVPQLMLYGQWTPEFGNTERYRGRVIDATLGNMRIGHDRVVRSAELRSRFLAGDVLMLTVIAGPAPQHNSPVFNIYDERRHEVLSIMAEDNDLLIRHRMRASTFRLDQPTFLLRGALTGVGPNEPWSLRMHLVAGGICARTESTAVCPLGFSITRGWSVLLHTSFARGVEELLDVLWLVLLFLPAGTLIFGWRAAVLPALLCIVGLLTADALAGLLPIGPADVLAGMSGMFAGALIRARAVAPLARQHPSFLPNR